MVYISDNNSDSYYPPFNTRILENQGWGVVSASDSVPDDTLYIRTPIGPSRGKPYVSIVICTYERPESLNETLLSLTKQTFKNFEVILITEKGDLSALRHKGLQSAVGNIVSFIDDDVYCPATWLESVTQGFGEGILGVTGPTWITEEYSQNRDIIKYKTLRKIHNWAFKVPTIPGYLSETGAPSMESNEITCSYEGPVQYLECCNMSIKREEALDAGGFDSNYIRTAEWCEVDLSLKLGKKGSLLFIHECGLYHKPSQGGVYKFRLQTSHRWKNFMYFQKKWVKDSLRTSLYRGFVWIYLKMKDLRMI